LIDVLFGASEAKEFFLIILEQNGRRGEWLTLLIGFEEPAEDVVDGFAASFESCHPLCKGWEGVWGWSEGCDALGGGLCACLNEGGLSVCFRVKGVAESASVYQTEVELVHDQARGVFSGADFHIGTSHTEVGCAGNVTSKTAHWEN